MGSQHPKKTVVLKDVANQCGVTSITVSRALRGVRNVNPDIVARVKAAAAELGYDPEENSFARRLRLRREQQYLTNHTIGLLFPPHFHAVRYFLALFQGVMNVLPEHGYGLITTCNSAEHPGTDPWFPPAFSRGDVDGLIGLSLPNNLRHAFMTLRKMKNFGHRPIVSLMWHLPEYPVVMTDDAYGAYVATRHLLELGHRDLLQFFNPASGAIFQARLSGIRAAFAEFNLDADAHLHLFRQPAVPGDWLDPEQFATMTTADAGIDPREQCAREEFLAFLQAHPAITAILALNDTNARHAWCSLNQAGLRVPEEYSLIGFDDVDPVIDEIGRSILTSVRLPLVDVGEAAAHLVMALVEGREPASTCIVKPTSLSVRYSTAPPR